MRAVCEYAFALLFKCSLKAFEAQRKANIDYLKSMIIANIAEPEEQLSLFETWLKSASNPKIKRLELLTRMNGFERYADKQGHEGWFITLTAPSKYHAMLSRTSSVTRNGMEQALRNTGLPCEYLGENPCQTQP
ncbi:Bacteriophage replication gene A protein (GPA) [Mannheimia haemolytica]|uniref:Bacteriophage replication gene A protein (GPA) n=1 Tax=Mannheimia haemolytica TaxID=75985 RepID=A0A378PYA5_MANHA|nr:Bacteriophage replication gene A protein (GPA) [Mannheimia haemolytica]